MPIALLARGIACSTPKYCCHSSCSTVVSRSAAQWGIVTGGLQAKRCTYLFSGAPVQALHSSELCLALWVLVVHLNALLVTAIALAAQAALNVVAAGQLATCYFLASLVLPCTRTLRPGTAVYSHTTTLCATGVPTSCSCGCEAGKPADTCKLFGRPQPGLATAMPAAHSGTFILMLKVLGSQLRGNPALHSSHGHMLCSTGFYRCSWHPAHCMPAPAMGPNLPLIYQWDGGSEWMQSCMPGSCMPTPCDTRITQTCISDMPFCIKHAESANSKLTDVLSIGVLGGIGGSQPVDVESGLVISLWIHDRVSP
jgi:hypothetical protein